MVYAELKMRTTEEIARKEQIIKNLERHNLDLANENKVLGDRLEKKEKEIDANKDHIIKKQERQIFEMANENKMLGDRVKKQGKEIEIPMEQQSHEKPMKEPDLKISPGKEHPQVMRYA